MSSSSTPSTYFSKALHDTSLIHTNQSPQYDKAKSLLGWQYVLEEKWEEAISTLFAASNLCKDLCLNDEEVGLDVDYRYFKAIELRATDPSMIEKSKDFLMKLLERRKRFDDKHKQSLIEFREGKLQAVLTVIPPTGMDSSHVSTVIEEESEEKKGEVEIEENLSDDKPSPLLKAPSSVLPSDIIGKINACEEQDSTLIYYDEAVSLWTKGEIERSIELIEYCLLLRKRKFGPMSPCSTTLYLEYAHLLREKGNYFEAKTKLEQGLNFLIKAYGKMNLKVSELLNSIGNILRLLGSYDEAFNILEETLSIRTELLGETDIQVGATLNNIAELLREKRQYEESLKYHERAVNIFKLQVGLNHPGTMNVLGNQGITQQRYSNKFKRNGVYSLDASLSFMHDNNFESTHPWVVKFSHEKLFYSVENNLQNNIHAGVTLGYLETILTGKINELKKADPNNETLSNYYIKGLDFSPTAPLTATGSSANTVDEFSIENLRYLKFITQLSYCQELLDNCLYKDAFSYFFDVIDPFQEEHVSHTVGNKLELEFHQKLNFLRHQIQFYQSTNSSKQLMHLNSVSEIISSIKKNIHANSPILIPIYFFLIESYLSLARYSEARLHLTHFNSLLTYQTKFDQTCFGTISYKNAQNYLHLHALHAQLHTEVGDYLSAKKSLDLCVDFVSLYPLLKNTYAYANYQLQVGNYNAVCGTYQKIITAYKESLRSIINSKGKENILYAKLLLLISQWECISGNFSSAEVNFQEASTVIREILVMNNLSALNISGHPILAFQYYVSGLYAKSLDKREEARKSFEIALEKSKNWFFDDHPLTILIHTEIGEVLALLREFNNSELHFSKAFFIYTNFFEGGQPVMGKVIQPPPPEQACQYYKAKIYLGQTKGKFQKGDFIAAAEFNKLSLDTVNSALASHSNISNMTSLFHLEILIMETKIFPIFDGSVKRLRDLTGTVGTLTSRFFNNSNNIYSLTSLILKGHVYTTERRNKDSKIVLSLAYIITMLLFSTRAPHHHLMLQVLNGAFHNMRQLGYFRDANEVLNKLESLTDKFYKKESFETFQYLQLNYAYYFIDTKKYSRAEEYIKTVCQPLCTMLYGEKFYFSLQLKTLLSKSLLMQCLPVKQSKQSKKQNTEVSSEAFATSLSMFEENIKGLSHYVTNPANLPIFLLEAKDDFFFLPLCNQNINPEENKNNLISYENNIMAIYKRLYSSENITTSNYSDSVKANHSYPHLLIVRSQARQAQIMNMIRRESGRKQIFDVMDKYDTYPIYPLPYDHPYVQELGGYEKSSSKDRISRNIEEDAFSAWASYDYEDYIGYKDKDAISIVPRNIFIDIQNNDIGLWGEVHFYGEENEEIRKKIRPVASISENRAIAHQEQASHDQKKSEAVTSEALEAEMKKRKEAEDMIVTLNFEKQNLEEALEEEKEMTANLTQRLNEEIEEKLQTRKKLDDAETEINDLIKRLRDTEKSLDEYIKREEEEIRRKKEEEEIRKAEEAARIAAELELAEKMKGVRVFNHEENKALDSATYSLSRAQALIERGWHSKALTLLTETVLIREKLLGLYHNEYHLALFQYAKCLSEMKLYQESTNIFTELLRLHIKTSIKDPDVVLSLKLDSLQEILDKREIMEQDFPLQIRVELVSIQIYQHLYPDAEAEIDRLSRTLSDKTSNPVTKTKNALTTFAKLLNIQALVSITKAKYPEAKAHLDRAHTLFQKSIGYHGYGTIETLLIRASLAQASGKPKEISAVVDQIQIVLESHFRGVDTSVPPDTIPPSETITNDVSDIINVNIKLFNTENTTSNETNLVTLSPDKKKSLCHPYLVISNIMLAEAFFQQSRYYDAKIKIDKAKEMLAIFTPSFLVDERHIYLDILHARYLTLASRYMDAKAAYLHLQDSVVNFYKSNYPEDTLKYCPLLATFYYDVSFFLYKVGHYTLSRSFIEKTQTFASRLKAYDIRFIESQILNVRISFALEEFGALQVLIENIHGQLEVIIPSEIYSYHYLYQTLAILDTSYLLFCKHAYSDVEQKFDTIIKQLRVFFSNGHALLAEALGNKFLACLYKNKTLKTGEIGWDILKTYLEDFNIGTQSVYAFAIEHEALAKYSLYKSLLTIFEIEYQEKKEMEEEEAKALAETMSVPVSSSESGSEPVTSTDIVISENESPELDLTKYFDLLDTLSHGVEKLAKSFGFKYSEKQDIYSSNSIIELAKPTVSVSSSKSIFNTNKREEVITLESIKNCSFFCSPIVLYTEAKIGQVKLMAHVSQQKFLKSLTDGQKVEYFATLNDSKNNTDVRYSYYNIGMKTNSKNKNSEPQGKKVLQNSIDIMLDNKSKPGWHVTMSHSYPSELSACLNTLKLRYDPLQIALSKFEKAKEKIKNNDFIIADFLLDEAFILITTAIGIKLSSNSEIVAQILFHKGANSRNLSRNHNFIRSIFSLSLKIYRLNAQDVHIQDMFCSYIENELVLILMDQFLYDEAIFNLKILISRIQPFLEDYPLHIEDKGEGHTAEVNKMIAMLNNPTPDFVLKRNELYLHLITAQLNISLCYANLHSYDLALKFNAEARVNFNSLISTITKNRDIELITKASDSWKQIFDIEVRLSLNEAKVLSSIGQFYKAHKIFAHIEDLIKRWTVDQAYMKLQEVKSADILNQLEVENYSSQLETLRFISTHDLVIRLLNSEDFKLQSLVCDFLTVKADYYTLINRLRDAGELIEMVIEKRIFSFNRFAPVSEETKTGKIPPKKPVVNQDPILQVDKQDCLSVRGVEIRRDFMLQLDQLVTYTNSNQIKIDKVEQKVKKNEDLDPIEAEMEKSIQVCVDGWNSEIMLQNQLSESSIDQTKPVDFDELKKANIDSQSFTSSLELDIPTIQDFKLNFSNVDSKMAKTEKFDVSEFSEAPNLNDVFFNYNNNKLTPHSVFIPLFLLQTRISFLKGNVQLAKISADLAVFMGNLLLPKVSYVKLEIDHLYGELKIFTNQLEEANKLLQKCLEDRLSLSSSHAIVLFEDHENIAVSRVCGESYFKLAQLNTILCNWDEANQYISDALKTERSILNSTSILNILNAVSRVDYTDTFTPYHYFNKEDLISLEIDSDVPPPVSHTLSSRELEMLLVSSDILLQKGAFAESLTTLLQLIPNLKILYSHDLISGGYHLHIVENLYQTAFNYYYISRFDLALSTLHQAVNLITMVSGDNSHFYFGLLNHLQAKVYREIGKFLDAKSHLDNAIVCLRTTFGKYHFLTVKVLLDLGQSFFDLGRYDTSKLVLERAIYLLKKSLGKDHLLIAQGDLYLGELLINIGKFGEAQTHLDNSLFIVRKVMGGEQFPIVTLIYICFTELKIALSSFEIAFKHLEQAMYVAKFCFSAVPQHIVFAKIMFYNAKILYNQCKLFDARLSFEKTIRLVKKLNSDTANTAFSPLISLESQLYLTHCMYDIGQIEQAKASLVRCLTLYKDTIGSSHPKIANILTFFGQILNTQHQYALAESVLMESWVITTRDLKDVNPDHSDISWNLIILADNLRMRGLLVPEDHNPELQENALDSDTVNSNYTGSKSGANSSKSSKNSPTRKSKGFTDLVRSTVKSANTYTLSSNLPKEPPQGLDVHSSEIGQDPQVIEAKNLIESKKSQDSMVIKEFLNDQSQMALDDYSSCAESQYSAPTVAISMIECLETSYSITQLENQVQSSSMMALGINDEAKMFMQDHARYRALPLVESAVKKLMVYYEEDSLQPRVLYGKYILAETLRMQGQLEESLSLHESIYQQRRKVLGDLHIDCIFSLVSITEVLKLMKKVFPKTPGVVFNTSLKSNFISTSGDSLNKESTKQTTSGIGLAEPVKLADQLTSILLPVLAPMKKDKNGAIILERPDEYDTAGFIESDLYIGTKKTFVNEEPDQFDPNDLPMTGFNEFETIEEKMTKKMKPKLMNSEEWKFLTKPKPVKNSNKAPLQLKGYMGYAFPQYKESINDMSAHLLSSLDAENDRKKNKKNNSSQTTLLHDPRKCVELALSLIKKIMLPFLNKEMEDKERQNLAATTALTRTRTSNTTGRSTNSLTGSSTNTSTANLSSNDHPLIAHCLFLKAEISRIRNEDKNAIGLYENSLSMRRRIFRSKHGTVADCLIGFAELLRGNHRCAQALPLFDKALEIRLNIYGRNHPLISEFKNSLAMLYLTEGDLTVAEKLLHESLAIAISSMDVTKHPSIALLYQNLAILSHSKSEYTTALNWHKKSISMKLKIYGEEHPEIAISYNNLGLVYRAVGMQDEAVTSFIKAERIQRYTLGAKHPDLASTLNNLASIYSSMEGKKLESKELFKQSLNIRMANFGENHPLVAMTMNNFAILLHALGDMKQSKQLFESSLEIRKKILSESSPSIAESLHNLAYWHYTMAASLSLSYLSSKRGGGGVQDEEDYMANSLQHSRDARALYEEALRIRIKAYGNPDAVIPNSLTGVMPKEHSMATAGDGTATATNDSNTFNNSILTEEEEKNRHKKEAMNTLGNHILISNTTLHLSGVCEQLGDLTMAHYYAKQSYLIRENLYGDLSPLTVASKNATNFLQEKVKIREEKEARRLRKLQEAEREIKKSIALTDQFIESRNNIQDYPDMFSSTVDDNHHFYGQDAPLHPQDHPQSQTHSQGQTEGQSERDPDDYFEDDTFEDEADVDKQRLASAAIHDIESSTPFNQLSFDMPSGSLVLGEIAMDIHN